MRCLERNKRTLWLSRREQSEIVDERTGLGTGEYASSWTEPVEVRVNAAPPTGSAESSPFGTDADYDLALVAASNPWGIREGDTMWLRDEAPDVSGEPDTSGCYEVVRVSPSLNFVAFGLSRRSGR